MDTKTPSKFENKRLNTEQWQEIMLAYDQSGLTQEAFCDRESLAPSTFYSWRKRLKGIKKTKPKKSMFVELTPPQTEQQPIDWDVELRLGDHIVLRLRQP